jgi:HPt (histidine-containing phosphotransfer) domain-containing protein
VAAAAVAVAERGDRPASALPPGPLDLGHLRRFTGGDRELEREVLQLFGDQALVTFKHMQQAASEKAWRDAAHTLKGSSFAVGANAVARLAAEAEMMREQPGSWPDVLERLQAAIIDARRFIAAQAPAR